MNTCWQLKVELLTPLHVGTGNKLLNECDYVKKGAGVFVVDQTHLFQSLANSQEDLRSLLAHTTHLGDLVKVLGEEERGWGYQLNPFEKGTSISANEIHAHLKDAFFRPYLPGSSLKGAIRTVLLENWVDQQERPVVQQLLPTARNKPKKVKAAEELSKKCFGDIPNSDWLRALHVSDVLFDSQDLTVTDVRYLNLWGQPPQVPQARWKDMGSRCSQHHWRDARGIFAESLQPQVEGILTLQIDHFLFDNPQAQSILKWQSSRLFRDFSEFRALLNHHAQHRLIAESQFFGQYGVSAAAQKCEKLLQYIRTDGTTAAYLQVGWGNGWRGMTGDWMDDTITGQIRQLYGLGSRTGMIFPKTRRLIVQAGQPCLPFGWLRILSPEESNLWLQAQQEKAIQAWQKKEAIEREQQARAIQEQQRKEAIDREQQARAIQEQQRKEAIERQIIAEAERKAKLSPLERRVEEVIAATPNQAGYISLLQALKNGQWESTEDQQAVAQMIREQMKQEKVWKETTQAKKPERDKNYQRTLEVLKFL